MECLVKIYNKDSIKNLVSIFSYHPKKIIFLYDSRFTSQKELTNLKNACSIRLNKSVLEFVEIDKHSIDKTYLACKHIINKNPDCFFDITGAGELCAIAVYLSCKKNFTPIFSVDIERGRLVNIYGCNYLVDGFSLPKISTDALFQSHGVTIVGSNHPKPTSDMYDNILKFCDNIFSNIEEWKKTCFFLQTALSSNATDCKSMQFSSARRISVSGSELYLKDTRLIYLAEELGFLRNVYIDNNKITFLFKNGISKKYMTDFGTWLELYTFVKTQREPAFNDVRISTKINWTVKQKNIPEVTNEIDVTFVYGIHAVFVSCKLSDPPTTALQELSVYSTYLGGQYSKCILVTLANINKSKSHLIARAEDMGITIIDGRTIREGKLIESIKAALDAPKDCPFVEDI